MTKKEWLVLMVLIIISAAISTHRYQELKAQHIDILGGFREVAEPAPEPDPEETPSVEITHESLGEFTITHYCTCSKCCGKSDGVTASGTVARPHWTVAVDPKIIPLGTVLQIEGIYYVAEDTGGSIRGKKIDICMESHEQAIYAGTKNAEVFKVGVMPAKEEE